MNLERKKDRSVYYFIKGILAAYPSINVVDAYPMQNLVLPTVSVEWDDITIVPLEQGNRIGTRDMMWSIDILANNKDQRDEIASVILDNIETGIPVYNYDEGFPPTVSPTQIGLLTVYDITASPIRIFPELVEKLYWRITINFGTKYEEI